MPVLSRFYGIIIRMYFQQSEHNPPHIHAIYGENVAAIDFQEKKIIEGELPKKALELVTEWISIHEEELKEIWDTQNFKKIKPLE
ncbi:MAG: DUF4160 domain-containing protein [Clostridia bacterium]